jgi:transposase
MMDRKQLEETITQLMQINDTLRAEREVILNDVARLKTDYATLVEATRVLTTDRDALKLKNVELETINKRLTDMLWGRRSERRTFSSNQPLLTNFGAGDDSQSPEAVEDQSSPEVISAQQKLQEALDKRKLEELEERRKNRRERKNRNEEFPASIERRVRVLDLPEDQKEGLKYLGTKITERLRFEKPNVYVEQIQRLEYVKVGAPELGVQSVPPPPSIIEGCKYDFSIIAAVAAMKVGFHMPTYRQETFFGQSGWNPGRSTLNDLMNYAVDCIDPLFEQMWSCIHQQPIMLGDATTLTVLLREEVTADDQQALETRKKNRDKALEARLKELPSGNTSAKQPAKQSGSATSYAWLYAGLDYPGLSNKPAAERPPPNHSPPDFTEPRWRSAPYNIFYWSLTQQHSVIDKHLEKFQGTFVGDAIGANARLGARSDGRIAHQSCNAHARREFVKAESNDPLLASQMISFYRQLYAVEYRAAELTPDERLALRQREAVPIWQRMQAWLDRDDVKRVLPKSGIGQAVSYLRNQWSSLQLYLHDGRLPIDNNQSERTIRPLTIGRKNWLFLGSAQAAPGRMKLFSIVSSAQRHCLSIQDYLEDILLRLSQAAQHDPKQLEIGSPLLLSLLPDRWGALHPQHVHQHRLIERQTVAEDKQYYRLQAGLTGSHPYAQTPTLSNA